MLAFEISGYDELHTLEVLRIAHAITPKSANLCTGAAFLPMFILLFRNSSSGYNLKQQHGQLLVTISFKDNLSFTISPFSQNSP